MVATLTSAAFFSTFRYNVPQLISHYHVDQLATSPSTAIISKLEESETVAF
jgi:hypothetical protein